MADGAYLKVTCTDEADFNHIAMSPKMFIHPFPETGLLRETDVGFSFKGKYDYVQQVLDAFSAALNHSAAPARKRRSFSGKVNFTKESKKNWPIF